ncbi:hypothetical protein ACFWMU_10625 [Streptomyces sp. NPDC058357]|uniref:hypothetical protein n=1 Tax=unclassified Streptomyces TaxID=2593676 RepID=UPI003660298D
MEIPIWVAAIFCVLSVLLAVAKRTPPVLREAEKIVNAYYDLREVIAARRRAMTREIE